MSSPFLHKHIAFSTLAHYVLQCYCHGKLLSFFQQLHYAQKEMMINKLDCIFKAACTNNKVMGSLSFIINNACMPALNIDSSSKVLRRCTS